MLSSQMSGVSCELRWRIEKALEAGKEDNRKAGDASLAPGRVGGVDGF